MTTVLFADRDGSALGPLGERTVPALLPLQGAPVLERMLEALVANGLRAALLVVGPRSGEIEKRFGKGIRWGIALEYVRREEGESPGGVLRRVEPRLDGDTLVVRGDVGAHAALGEFLAALEGRGEPVLAATLEGRPAGLWRISQAALKKAEIPREPAASGWELGAEHIAVPLSAAPVLLDSIQAYRRADRAEKPAVSPRAQVDPKATLGAGSTVAEDAAVLAGATLRETSLLARSVVPSGIVLENAVVQGNLVLDAETGAAALLTDRLPPRPSAAATVSAGSRPAGMLALALSIPLWPLALAWSLVANAGHATRQVTFSGNAPGTEIGGPPRRAPFTTFRFETAVPVLRDLPLLLAVASGKLALTGVTLLTPADEAALTEPWEKVRLEAPVGLVSLASLAAPASAAPEVWRMVDAFQARGSGGGLLRQALAGLFTARAWTAPRGWNPDELPEAAS